MCVKDWVLLFLTLNAAFSVWVSACVTSRGIVGTCLPLNQCAVLTEILSTANLHTNIQRKEFLANWRCTARGNNVCCPNDEVYSEPPPFVENHPNLHLLPDPSQCATYKANRIHGGDKTDPLTYTWMALIATDGETERDFSCGGSIINSRYILTAAHCITKLRKAELAGVRVGEHDIFSDDDCITPNFCAPPVQDLYIEAVIPHPGYVGLTEKGINLQHDIGLLRLSDPIDLTKANVKPTCLPVSKELRELSLENSNLIMTGWGRTNIGDDGELLDFEMKHSNELLVAKLPIVSNKLCAENYNASGIGGIGFRQLCAGGLKGVSSCLGDSGGPAGQGLKIGRKVNFVQYGVVSAGAPCGSEGKPNIFTNVLYYMDWILDQLEP